MTDNLRRRKYDVLQAVKLQNAFDMPEDYQQKDLELDLCPWVAKIHKRESANQYVDPKNLNWYKETLTTPVDVVTRNVHGVLYNGDVVRVRHAGRGGDAQWLAALPKDVDKDGRYGEPCRATATGDGQPLLRTSVHVFRNDVRIPATVPLRTDECIYFCTSPLTGSLFLTSELKTFDRYAGLSGNQAVHWSSKRPWNTLWKVLPLQYPQSRHIQVNVNVALKHVSTGQNLALEDDCVINSVVGQEFEVTAHSHASDTSRTIGWQNVWRFECPYDETLFPEVHHDRPRPSFQAIHLDGNRHLSPDDVRAYECLTERFETLLDHRQPFMSGHA